MNRFNLTPSESLLDDHLNFRTWIKEKSMQFPTHHNYQYWSENNERNIDGLLSRLNYSITPFLEMLTSKP